MPFFLSYLLLLPINSRWKNTCWTKRQAHVHRTSSLDKHVMCSQANYKLCLQPLYNGIVYTHPSIIETHDRLPKINGSNSLHVRCAPQNSLATTQTMSAPQDSPSKLWCYTLGVPDAIFTSLKVTQTNDCMDIKWWGLTSFHLMWLNMMNHKGLSLQLISVGKFVLPNT